ncbi:hypothetical protein BH09BAC6_BH09BAC6_21380 [soil metagenome]
MFKTNLENNILNIILNISLYTNVHTIRFANKNTMNTKENAC